MARPSSTQRRAGRAMWGVIRPVPVTNVFEATSEVLDDFKPPLMKTVVMIMTSFKHLNTGQKTKADPIHLYFTVWGLIHNRAFIPKNAEHFFPQDTIPDFNKNVLHIYSFFTCFLQSQND